jgi:hypothetical protein
VGNSWLKASVFNQLSLNTRKVFRQLLPVPTIPACPGGEIGRRKGLKY